MHRETVEDVENLKLTVWSPKDVDVIIPVYAVLYAMHVPFKKKNIIWNVLRFIPLLLIAAMIAAVVVAGEAQMIEGGFIPIMMQMIN